MTENDFWYYLHAERDKGVAKVMAGGIKLGNDPGDASVDYMTGHSLLPENYDNISQERIIEIGKLLFQADIKTKTKEAILILLAHQPTRDALFFVSEYNKQPDERLKTFAMLALDECLMWNE
ncbi:MAG: hypothetical protein KJ995_06445 [Candidatus Omnitrophica bacterium]|nr:hypothetical protein [Candidatus Omnitrophota bacterium]MBU1128238.1 hypothetical protein [Candidatus Omnitrophota bacterium]MBU1784211.1 hypothetical protein [Candidatus Omnitrophota bacterium]MBU1852022.1 hypothetical protein [Candidatus Omnitrophota bacterium]